MEISQHFECSRAECDTANRTHTQFSRNRIRRIKAGILDFGARMLPSNNPVELGMERMMKGTFMAGEIFQ